METIKQKTSKVVKTGKRVFSNAEQFVMAVALIIVAVAAYDYQSQVQLPEVVRVVVLVSLVIIGLRGMYELVKFLDRE